MRRLLALVAVAVASAVVLAAFTSQLSGETPVLPATPLRYTEPLPALFDVAQIVATDNTPAANPTTDAGATLGRVLFYDTRLSLNETLSCASCHKQAAGFSDPATHSVGFAGGQTARHSMSLAFSRFYPDGRFFWDERASTLEDQVLMPIQDGTEMGMSLGAVVSRLEATTFYPGLFARAFGTPDVSAERVSRALAQFVRSMATGNSRWDVARAAGPPGPPGRTLPRLTAQENLGLDIFFGRGQCNRCHANDTFTADMARNNGLDATVTDPGAGNGRFKVGSLRNVERSAPYMHDGRFATLEQVVAFYDSGIQNNPFLDPRLRDGNGPGGGRALRLNLSAAERAALVAFLKTLTDDTIATDERWSDPFPRTATSGGAPPEAHRMTLEMAGPNPLRTRTVLRLTLPEAADVTVDLFDATGRRVARLAQGARGAGESRLEVDASGLPAGRYVVRASAGGKTATRALTVVR